MLCLPSKSETAYIRYQSETITILCCSILRESSIPLLGTLGAVGRSAHSLCPSVHIHGWEHLQRPWCGEKNPTPVLWRCSCGGQLASSFRVLYKTSWRDEGDERKEIPVRNSKHNLLERRVALWSKCSVGVQDPIFHVKVLK